ncbi:MAG: polyhydroxyalkanoate depolymerase [Magnetospirillum sp.]|nr:polyhydroxyalkanoate depolymerase [Magnetospirillum sp.]
MRPPSLSIAAIPLSGRSRTVTDQLLLERPNWLLRRFAKAGRLPSQPRVLVVAPLSGHFGWLMRDTVLGLLPGHDVFLLEWLDARDIPAAVGRLGLDACVAAIMEALRTLGPGVAVLGVSQAPVPILAAAALMAAHGEAERPRALMLMGGFIDPRRSPTAVERLTARLPAGWFTRTMAATVPAGEAGHGRRIYPGTVHGRALTRYLGRHLTSGGELRAKVTQDDGADPQRFPFLRLYTTLMDLPAEFAEENARKVFAEALLPRGQLACLGRLVEPARIADIGLMTVEGEADDSSGPGHTHAAHALCPALVPDLRRRLTVAGVGHFGLFHGHAWRTQVLPQVTAFLAHLAKSPPPKTQENLAIHASKG